MRRPWVLLFLLVILVGVWQRATVERAWYRWSHRAHPSAPTVILIVLDTTRADHLSACGYTRPTSPTLAALAKDAVFTCNAYAPGSWTLPGHASLFTGLAVPDHGADSTGAPDAVGFFGDQSVRPLAAGFETVAETLAARGYQTVSLSENPVLAPWSGLTQGFDQTWAPAVFADQNRALVRHRLLDVLDRRVDPGQPLFLVVNLSEPHDPLSAIPDGVGWLPARPALECFGDLHNPCFRFGRGEMGATEAEAFLAWQQDAYDWGLARQDAALADVLAAVDERGWRDGPFRLVIVADHGELLGEHGVIGHDEYLWEPVTRVPLLVAGVEGLALPDPVSTRVVHRLLVDGVLPAAAIPVEAVGNPMGYRERGTGGKVASVRTAARWEGRDKRLWTDGVVARYDVGTDPAEEHPLPAVEDPALLDLAAANVARFSTADGTSAETTEQLRALGYVK